MSRIAYEAVVAADSCLADSVLGGENHFVVAAVCVGGNFDSGRCLCRPLNCHNEMFAVVVAVAVVVGAAHLLVVAVADVAAVVEAFPAVVAGAAAAAVWAQKKVLLLSVAAINEEAVE